MHGVCVCVCVREHVGKVHVPMYPPLTADKLIRHTGYGNAAGLLLGRGLLGGGTSAEAANYSSDSEAEEEAE